MNDLRTCIISTVLTVTMVVQCLSTDAFAQNSHRYVLTGAQTARFNDNGLTFVSMDVVIEGNRIVEVVEPTVDSRANSGDPMDAAGLYLMPGLIDLHTHLTTAFVPSSNTQEFLVNYVRQFQEPLERRAVRATVAAQATLRAGVTSVRDVSTEGAGFLDVTLANAIQEGIVVGPRIFPATAGIAATDGYMPFAADGRSAPQAAQTADTPAELLDAVRQQHANGAKWIKVFADFPKDVRSKPKPTYSVGQLSTITTEARRLGLRVAAHVYTDDAARNCIAAGVDTIEHGFGLSEDIMGAMRSRKILLVPTISGVFNGFENGADNTLARSIAEKIIHSGVPFGIGSDAGSVVHHGANVIEMIALVELGLSATEVLSAATIVGAGVLDQSNQLGQIEPTYKADVVAYRENPLDDIRTILDPVLVIKDGLVVLDARE